MLEQAPLQVAEVEIGACIRHLRLDTVHDTGGLLATVELHVYVTPSDIISVSLVYH